MFRSALIWSVVLFGAIGLMSWLIHVSTRDSFVQGAVEAIESDASLVESKITEWAQQFQEESLAVATLPQINQFIGSYHAKDPQFAQHREQVAYIFESLMQSDEGIFQVRLINRDQGRLIEFGNLDYGNELLRFDRKPEGVVDCPEDSLQNEQFRSYFLDALSCPEGEVFLSALTFHRERGEIARPLRIAMRACIPISSDKGGKMLLVISYDVGELMRRLEEIVSPGTQLYLAQKGGDFTFHVDGQVIFGSDALDTQNFQGTQKDTLSQSFTVGLGSFSNRFFELQLNRAPSQYEWILSLTNWEVWDYVLTAEIAGVGAILAVFLSWLLSRRLSKFSKIIESFGDTKGVIDQELVEGRLLKGEIGVLARQFRSMANEVDAHIQGIEAAKMDAERANLAKDRFLAVVSHEIRTPLNSIQGLVKDLATKNTDEEKKAEFALLQSAVDYLIDLANTNLDYSHIKEGEIRFVSSSFDASQMVLDLVEVFKPIADEKGLRFDLEIPEDLGVEGDSVRLRQVMTNLLSNSFKFTDEGFVKVKIGYKEGRLFGEVSDSGCGIAQEDLEKIFDAFYRSKKVGFGAGLGLTITRDLIEMQGGSMGASSELGKGSRFYFELPYPRSVVPSSSSSSSSFKEPLSGLRGLYVEDSLANQWVMSLAFEAFDGDLTCVSTGGDALNSLKKEAYDVYLLDLQLPDLNGLELADEIHRVDPHKPVILVTAQSSVSAQSRKQHHLADVLLKPYFQNQLVEVLLRHLQNHTTVDPTDDYCLTPELRAEMASAIVVDLREAQCELERVSREGLDQWVQAFAHKMTTSFALFELSSLEAQLQDCQGEEALRKEKILEALEESISLLEGAKEAENLLALT